MIFWTVLFACSAWPAGRSRAALLAQIGSAPDEELARRFWNDWCNCLPGRESIFWITAFWESPDNSVMFDFYTSPAIHDRMTKLALSEQTQPDLAAKASAVASVIEANSSSI